LCIAFTRRGSSKTWSSWRNSSCACCIAN
jgi:hypothetical protein